MRPRREASREISKAALTRSFNRYMTCRDPFCRRPAAPKSAKKGGKCHRCHQIAFRLLHPMEAAYANLRDHSRERGIVFALPFPHFVRFARKANYLGRKGQFPTCLTVDRIDNLRGYEPGNIQPLTRSANSVKRMKQDAVRMRAGFAWKN